METIKKLKKVFIPLIIILLAGTAWLFLFSDRGEKNIEYTSVPAARADIRSVIQATGTLDAVETVDVGTKISGTISNIYIDYNSTVKEGQLIAEIESESQSAEVEQVKAALMEAEASLIEAEAQFVNASKNLGRTRKLAERDLISKSDVDADEKLYQSAKARKVMARARIMQVKAQLRKANLNLGYTKIYSPVNGVVVAKNVDAGQTVAASYQTPSIAEIAKDLSQMQVEVNVDEADIGGVHENQKAVFTVDAHPGKKFEGVVTQVRLAPSREDNVVTYSVIVKIENNEGLLMPGMTANVSLIISDSENVICVPNSALRFQLIEKEDKKVKKDSRRSQGKAFSFAENRKPQVYVLEGKNEPRRVFVEKGITDGQKTEIKSGLREGDKVITGIVIPEEEK